MAIGTSRRNSLAREATGWGAFFTTVKTGAISGATSLVLNGGGGPGYGTSFVSVGQKVAFIGSQEAPKTITAVAFAGGTPGNDATLTIAALANAVNQGDKVFVGWFADTALLLNSFSSKLNANKWSSSPFTGTRSKWVGRRHGRIESDGSLDFDLRPSVNATLIGHAIGYDATTGSTPTASSTISAATNPGDTSFSSASTAAIGDIVQIGTGSTAECRKVTAKVSTTFTVDYPLVFAHASGVAVAKVVAPFTHTIPSATSVLPSLALEDYVPYDNRTVSNPNGVTGSAYYLPGAILKSLKVSSANDTSIKVSMDFDAQDKVEVPVATNLTIPNEAPYAFDQEAVLINSTQNQRITDITLELTNDIQKVFAKNNSSRAFAIIAGQQEVKGSFKVYEDQASQDTFFGALSADTILAFRYKITDPVTGYYVQFDVPQIVIDDFQDGDFNPGDVIYGSLNFTAIYDSTSNGNLSLTIQNGDYLSY